MKIETPILRLLGPVPFWRGEAKCLDELEGIYRRARRAASDRLGASAGLDSSPSDWYNHSNKKGKTR